MAVFARLPRRYAHFGNHRVAYAVAGRGPVVLLLHGLGGTADFMQPLVAGLADRFTLLCPDLLGFGYSAKPTGTYSLSRHLGAMLAVVRAAGHEQFHAVVGHSAGGVVAIALLASGLLASERLVLAATSYPSPRFAVQQELLTNPYFKRLLADRGLARIDDAILRHVLWPLLRHIPVSAYLEGGRAGFLDYSVESYYGTAKEMLLGANLDPLLPRLPRVPTLLVYGRADRTVPLVHGQRLHAELPHSTLMVAEGGHYGIINESLLPLVEWLQRR